MVRGDTFSAETDVASNSNLLIQPASGVEAMIHQIHSETDSQALRSRTSQSDQFSVELGAGETTETFVSDFKVIHLAGRVIKFHVDNTEHVLIRNSDGAASRKVVYLGTQTK